MIDTDELYLCLHSNASAEQLWARWEFLRELLDQAGQDMAVAVNRWKAASDPVEREQLWQAYEATAREYRVLASWQQVHYAAYIFTTDGADCAALDGISSAVS